MLFIWPDMIKEYSSGVLIDDLESGEYMTVPIDDQLNVTFSYADESEKKNDQSLIDENSAD